MTQQRVALISGANRGIGAAVAQRLLQDGWSLSLGNRSASRPEWASDTERVHVFAYEATSSTEDAWCESALKQLGRIDAVIANAGIIIAKPVVEAEDEELDAMLEINVKAPRRLVKAAWPSLKASGRGRFVVMASLSGKRVASSRSGLYAMSKHAAVALAHAVRHDGWEHGIRSTAVCPGFVDTDMGRSVAAPSTLMTPPEDVARLVSVALDLDNSASLSEICVNCADGELF